MDLAEAPGRASPPLIAAAPDVEAAIADAALPRRPPTAEGADDASEAEASAAGDDEDEHHTDGKSSSLSLSEKENLKSPVDGQSQAGVSAIRGTSGSDFEAHCGVLRVHGVRKNYPAICCCPCLFDEKDVIAYGEVKRFVLVKGGSCFVFVDEETSPSPLYAIPLDGLRAEVDDPGRGPSRAPVEVSPSESNHHNPTLVTVLLTSAKSGTVEYQFSFDTGRAGDEDVARRFAAVVDKYGADDGVGTKTRNTASVVLAKTVAAEKGREQPDDAVNAQELH